MPSSTEKMKITLAQLSKNAQPIEVPKNCLVRTALAASGMSEDEMIRIADTIRVNGKPAKLGTRLEAGAFIAIAPKVQGA